MDRQLTFAAGAAPRRIAAPPFAPVVVATCLALGAVACGRPTPPPAPAVESDTAPTTPPMGAATPIGAAVPPPAQQGLSSDEITTLYHLNQGGELYPLSWLKALTDEDGQPFIASLGRYGFLADPADANGLPVGMTVSDEADQLAHTPMVGMTCAACHVGEWANGAERRVRIIGGPNLVDQKGFFEALGDATKRSLKSPTAIYDFLQAAVDEPTLAAHLQAHEPLAYAVLQNCTPLEKVGAAGAFGRELLAYVTGRYADEAADTDPPPNVAVVAEVPEAAPTADTASFAALDDGGADLDEGADESVNACPLEDEATRKPAVDELVTHLLEQQRLIEARLAFIDKIILLVHLPQTDFGPGRADDWDVARAQLFDKKWALPLTSPLSFPPMWNLDAYEWLHYDNNTNSIMQRNYGQAFGTGAPFEMKTYGSTVDPRQLKLAEDLARKITPAEWPAGVLGPIDAALAAKGEPIFRAKCAACHEGATPGSAPGDKLYALDVIGTDPNRITSFGTPLDGKPFAAVFPPELDKFMDWSMAHYGIDDAAAAELIGPEPAWRETNKYGTRALHGVWATAPFLHNGSVPTLYDLLKPAAERPKTFPVGSRVYDARKLGLTVESGEAVEGWTFDTTLDGNKNVGHEGEAFGTALGEGERMALLEYLKGY